MALKNVIQAVALSTVDTSTFMAAFVPFSAPLPAPCVIIRLINASTVPVTISYDGVTAHDRVLSGAAVQLYFQTNSGPNNFAAAFAQGTQVYAFGAAGVGLVYLAAYYQPQGA